MFTMNLQDSYLNNTKEECKKIKFFLNVLYVHQITNDVQRLFLIKGDVLGNFFKLSISNQKNFQLELELN